MPKYVIVKTPMQTRAVDRSIAIELGPYCFICPARGRKHNEKCRLF